MTELVVDVLRATTIGPKRQLEMRDRWNVLRPLSDFLAKEFGQWIREDYAGVYAYFSIHEVLVERGFVALPGALVMTRSAEELSTVAQAVCDFWKSLPLRYDFLFPLPAAFSFDSDTQLAPGVVLRKVEDNSFDLPSATNTLSGLLGALEPAQKSVTCISIAASGYMDLIDETELPASSAIRKAKVVLQLAKVERLGETRFLNSPLSTPSTSAAVLQAPRDVRRTLQLPYILQTGLAGLTWSAALHGVPQRAFSSRFNRIASVVEGYERWIELGRAKPRTAEEINDRQCARIATSAEWLFDAEHAKDSAMTLVQTAIGFEALYPGRKVEKGEEPEPIVSILSNRVAYSLGKSAERRETVRDAIAKFYEMRSSVVHSGGTGLSGDQRMQLSIAKDILRSALRHEMSLVTYVPAQ